MIASAQALNMVTQPQVQALWTDFEDAVTSAVANAAGVEVIVTRNITDFMASTIPAVLPEEFSTMPLE